MTGKIPGMNEHRRKLIPSEAINLVNLDLDEDSFCYLLEETDLVPELKGFVVQLAEFEGNDLDEIKTVGEFRKRDLDFWNFRLPLVKNLSSYEIRMSGWYILDCLGKLERGEIGSKG